MTTYLLDNQNENFALTMGYKSEIQLTLNGLGVPDTTGMLFAFDIGQEGEDALFTGDEGGGEVTHVSDLEPQQIKCDIPAGAFTETHQKLIFQLRFNDGAGDEIILKRFVDVRAAVTPI